jgi:hypothetical protein
MLDTISLIPRHRCMSILYIALLKFTPDLFVVVNPITHVLNV